MARKLKEALKRAQDNDESTLGIRATSASYFEEALRNYRILLRAQRTMEAANRDVNMLAIAMARLENMRAVHVSPNSFPMSLGSIKCRNITMSIYHKGLPKLFRTDMSCDSCLHHVSCLHHLFPSPGNRGIHCVSLVAAIAEVGLRMLLLSESTSLSQQYNLSTLPPSQTSVEDGRCDGCQGGPPG